MGNASDEELAGIAWEGPMSRGVEQDTEQEPAVDTGSSAPAPTSVDSQYLVQLIEAQLKLTQAVLEGIQLLRDDMRRMLG